MRRSMKRKAFTIIEMTIVIAVIAILATVMIPTIGGMIEKAYVSKDTQFAASLNVQLALWEVDHGDIKNEGDLRDAINEFYGDNYYETQFAPESGKYGYNYWYDIANNTVVLKSLSELAGTPAVTAEGEAEFSPASLRHGLVDGYYLLDRGGNELTDIINSLETEADPQEFENQLNALYALSTDTESEYSALAAKVLTKLDTVTVITNFGAARSSSINNITAVYVPVSVNAISVQKVYQYSFTSNPGENETNYTLDFGSHPSEAPLATKENVDSIELHSNVVIVAEGMPAIHYDFADGKYTGTTELHLNVSTVEELEKMVEGYATDCVITLVSTGAQYIVEGGNIFPIPRNVVNDSLKDHEGNYYTPPVSSGLGVTDIGDVEITYSDSNSELMGDGAYYYNNTLYIAFDMGSAQLSLGDDVIADMVNWTVSGDADISVDSTGLITINSKPTVSGCTATVTATAANDATNTDDITIHIVMPTTVSWTFGDSDMEAVNGETGNIPISYTGSNTEFALVLGDSVGYTQAGYVSMCDTIDISFETSGELFKIENGKLVMDPTKIATTNTQVLTVKYGSGTVNYIEQTYTITVTDNSASPFEVNKITDAVTMGTTYLFRVGNVGTFTLDKLFNSSKPGNDITLTIYDASKTDKDGNRSAIATSGSGFYATYTSSLTSSDWNTKTIKFSGTGVAIIEVVTPTGTATLAVEVVNGKNVTSASDFTGATNYVMLNDITWGSAKDVVISGTIYGNGFAINAATYKPAVSGNTAMFKLSGGTIDNLVINGPVYPELSYSGEEYYIAGIYATGNAKITNSYIAGFREPIMANGSSLYLENTTLVGGNYANLWLQTGSLTLKNVTTVQKPTTATIGSGTVLGAGIIANSGINASNVTIIGDLTQHNWVSKDQASTYMDSDVSSLINTFYNNTTITHTVGSNTKYINTGIVFQGANGTVNNASQTAGHGYTTETVSGSLMGVSISGRVYTRTTTAGTITSIPTYGGYTPNAQAVLKPTFKDNLTKTDGKVVYSIDIPNGATATLDTSVYTVSKYSGQNIAVNVTCSGTGVTVNGKKITFSKAGTFTVTYTVTDNTFFNADGTRNANSVEDTYTVTVVVSNSNHPSAVIDVSGVDKTIYMGLEGTTTDTDYAAFFAILKGLKITDYDADGNASAVSISTSTIPTGLTVTASNGEFTKQYTKDGVLYLGDSKANNNNDYSSITVTYKYTGANGKTVSATVTYTGFTNYTELYDERTSPSPCVTPDTLVTLADGTQKEIQYVTYEDMLLVWNFQTGEYDVMPAAIVMNHGYADYTVVALNFSDGTTVNTINGHGFFDVADRKFVILNYANVADYVGREFAKVDGDGHTTVTLDSFSIATEYTESWSILTAEQYNCILENMWTLTPAEVEGSPDYLMPFEIGEDMKYDEAKMQADIEKYGLYTYEDFAEYCTYEQFVAFGFDHFKVSVEKGYITWDGIEFLLNLHLGGNK